MLMMAAKRNWIDLSPLRHLVRKSQSMSPGERQGMLSFHNQFDLAMQVSTVHSRHTETPLDQTMGFLSQSLSPGKVLKSYKGRLWENITLIKSEKTFKGYNLAPKSQPEPAPAALPDSNRRIWTHTFNQLENLVDHIYVVLLLQVIIDF